MIKRDECRRLLPSNKAIDATTALVPSGSVPESAQQSIEPLCHETDMEAASMTGQITLKSLRKSFAAIDPVRCQNSHWFREEA